MPTPNGLPKKGEKIKHIPSGAIYEVIQREGSSVDYSIIVRQLDGDTTHPHHHPYGYPADHMRITEMRWMMNHHLWEVVT
jgi:hypothetical protein